MVLITIQELFAIQMLIGQDLLLIEDLHLGIVSPLVVTQVISRLSLLTQVIS